MEMATHSPSGRCPQMFLASLGYFCSKTNEGIESNAVYPPTHCSLIGTGFICNEDIRTKGEKKNPVISLFTGTAFSICLFLFSPSF